MSLCSTGSQIPNPTGESQIAMPQAPSPSSAAGFWMSRNLSHRILTVQCLDPGPPPHWTQIPSPQPLDSDSFTLTLGPRSFCFDGWTPTFQALCPLPLTTGSWIPKSQPTGFWLLKPQMWAQQHSKRVLAGAAAGVQIPDSPHTQSCQHWIPRLDPYLPNAQTPSLDPKRPITAP